MGGQVFDKIQAVIDLLRGVCVCMCMRMCVCVLCERERQVSK